MKPTTFIVVCLALIVIVNAVTIHSKHDTCNSRKLKKLQLEEEKKGTAIQTQWYTQRLDHFNHQDQRTWQQRYWVNDQYWKSGGPIFIMLGGEGALSGAYVQYTEMTAFAAKYGALQVAVEHRFYGRSQPFNSLSTENLAYLSSQQALADYANFLLDFQKKSNIDSTKTITFGCSYPGNLAAWFRLKYPHLTTAAIASSAPVQATLDFYQYLDVVDNSLTYFMGEQCDNLIRSATEQIESMLKSSTGRSKLQSLFKTCAPIVTDLDVSTFMAGLMGNWQGTVQYNDEIPGSPDIKSLCQVMINGASDPLTAYVNINNMFIGNGCFDASYADSIAQLTNLTDFGYNGVGIRQWTYQTCTEMGYFQTTSNTNQPFGDLVPVSYWIQTCKDAFGVNFPTQALVDQTNDYYGGSNLPKKSATRILFVNGSIDPWHSLGVTQSISDSLLAILIEGTAHCADTEMTNSDSLPALLAAQRKISSQIGIWLADATN